MGTSLRRLHEITKRIKSKNYQLHEIGLTHLMKIFYNPIKHLLVKEGINYKTQTIHLISKKFKIKLNITVI